MDDSRFQLSVQLARDAGALLRDYFRSKDLMTSLKPDHTLVTEADIAADQMISATIHQHFPEDLILTEEQPPGETGFSGLAAENLWIIDPLDGTTNFSLGLPFWGVSIAHLIGGNLESGVLHFPMVEELYTAQKERGAFLNGHPIYVEPPNPQKPISFFSCCSRTFQKYQVSVPYKVRILGSAAYTLCSVANGIAILGFEATPKIWDLAAGWLLVQEAGGIIDTLTGNQPFPIQIHTQNAQQSYPTLAAASKKLIQQAREQILPKPTL